MNPKAISLEEKKLRPVVDHLNDLLANYHVHYQKLRGCHWNVRGSHFFTLHAKFEELYNNAITTIDELAERILTLGKSPLSRYQDYLETAEIKEIDTIGMSDVDLVKAVVEDLEVLIALQRDLLEITDEANDEGSNDMVNAFMQFNEKQNWMLRAFLNKQ
ncbi:MULTISPECIES: Dps family protein [Olivibacter]|jgi:starvation-inducible DNA-binding protein|uniref:Ferritin Dps family protein n=3 Tax=Sphingobacteriaceae TaxID=84566 RepID=F4CAI7_SPHS2|nr:MULTISPECIES: DNA starvation/stationary phase protection protein [Olivibacter]MCL4642210.1 DNA starvation/stationary phase protection protein [Olivibacter sp. UJ_SKK_5.1]MDM8173486.1 DNA starvation/stationary phase protection protein [Olivibacter sp. 47]MDX3914577.1 DNA starvation/stationary phase protection protein [Pseudosphingobacterium sp.]QEL03209.1 DNA starvation/stationary phase protection protein [Olivibacter sp. LS-1]